MAFSTAVIAVAAIVQALVSYQQWSLTRQSNEVAQRAWLVLKNTLPQQIHLEANQPFTVQIVLENVGNSPALRVFSETTWFVGPNQFPKTPQYTVANEVDRSISVVGPKEPFTTWPQPPISVTQSLVDAIGRGESTLWIVGRVEYFDIFDVPRHTKYCLRYVPGPSPVHANLISCSSYNEID